MHVPLLLMLYNMHPAGLLLHVNLCYCHRHESYFFLKKSKYNQSYYSCSSKDCW
jgi:hypothetical protein